MGYVFAGPSYGLNLTASLFAAAIGLAALQTVWFTGAQMCIRDSPLGTQASLF